MAPSMRKKVTRNRREKDPNDTLDLPPPPPHLQSRESKKEKREIKSNAFKSKLNSNSDKISKSSLRRQKRKARSNLHGGNLEDMLSTLPEISAELKNASTTPFVAKKVAPIDPKKSSKKNAKVMSSEIDRFNKIVTDKSFRANPFESLKSFISSNMEKKKEFADMEKKEADKMQD